jgi:predicted aspartyl protease
MPSFTSKISNLRNNGPVVQAQVVIGSALENVLKSKGATLPSPISALAMIDTGASSTVIRDDIPSMLNLNPVGVVQISTPSSSNVPCSQYAVRLLLPNNVIVEVVAIAAPLKGQQIQCLIGRDILQHGVLIYNGYVEEFTLSF